MPMRRGRRSARKQLGGHRISAAKPEQVERRVPRDAGSEVAATVLVTPSDPPGRQERGDSARHIPGIAHETKVGKGERRRGQQRRGPAVGGNKPRGEGILQSPAKDDLLDQRRHADRSDLRANGKEHTSSCGYTQPGNHADGGRRRIQREIARSEERHGCEPCIVPARERMPAVPTAVNTEGTGKGCKYFLRIGAVARIAADAAPKLACSRPCGSRSLPPAFRCHLMAW